MVPNFAVAGLVDQRNVVSGGIGNLIGPWKNEMRSYATRRRVVRAWGHPLAGRPGGPSRSPGSHARVLLNDCPRHFRSFLERLEPQFNALRFGKKGRAKIHVVDIGMIPVETDGSHHRLRTSGPVVVACVAAQR